MWQSLWNWYYGKQNDATADTGLTERDFSALIAALGDKDEVTRLNAAYELGTIGAPTVPALVETWRKASEVAGDSESENDSSQHATFALSAIGGTGSACIGRGIRFCRRVNSCKRGLTRSAILGALLKKQFLRSLRCCGMNPRGCAVMRRKHWDSSVNPFSIRFLR